MAPFLRYLYCEPSQLREYAQLRMGLLKTLLQPHGPQHKEAPSVLECQILQLLCDLIPQLQVLQVVAGPDGLQINAIRAMVVLLLPFQCANTAYFSISYRPDLLVVQKSDKLALSGRS